jgi:hypothetical protein
MDDDNVRQSEDDALEEDIRPDDMFKPDIDEEKLPEDNDPPATPAYSKLDEALFTHPLTDDPPDRDEVYNGGLRDATSLGDTIEDSDNAPARPLEPED